MNRKIIYIIISLISIITSNLFSVEFDDANWKIENEKTISEIKNYFKNYHFLLNIPKFDVTSNLKTFEYYLNNLDTATINLNNFKIAEYKIVRTETGYFGKDMKGLEINFSEVYSHDKTKIFYGAGNYKKLFKASGVLILKYEDSKDEKKISCESECYIRLKSKFLYSISKLFKETIIEKCNRHLSVYVKVVEKYFHYINSLEEESCK